MNALLDKLSVAAEGSIQPAARQLLSPNPLSMTPAPLQPVVARKPKVIALLPAYNEQRNIAKAVSTLQGQTVAPDRIIVIPNNCSDATAHIAQQCGAKVRIMVDNKDKKAGALNWVLADILEDSRA